MQTETLSFDTANGPTSAYCSLPVNANGKGVIVIQEWWALNAHIKNN